MPTASLLPNGEQQFFDNNGTPLADGLVYFYVPNTSTLKNTWQDPNQNTLNTNPVVLDGAGRAIIYGSGQYRQVVKDSLDNTIWDQLTADIGYVAGQAGYLLNTNNLSDVSNTATARSNLGAAPLTSPTFLVGITTPLINGTEIGQAGTNVWLGDNALDSNTTGAGNVAIGGNALTANTSGGTITSGNTAVGYNAMAACTTGLSNTAVGNDAAKTLTTAIDVTAIGAHALYSNTGDRNTAVGAGALYTNAGGIHNTAVGVNAGRLNVSGQAITAIGYQALYNNTGSQNNALGSNALQANTTGSGNCAMGNDALLSNTTGVNNVAIGTSAMSGGIGSNNCAYGYQSLFAGTTPEGNAAYGYTSLTAVTSGAQNVGVGKNAGGSITTGSNNICIGTGSGVTGAPSGNITTANNQICLGNGAITNAYIQVAWTVVSDARDKTDIQPLPFGLEYVQQLRPVQFRYDARARYAGRPDGSRADQHSSIGFIAQEVAAAEASLGLNSHWVADTSDPELCRITETRLLPILVKAIQELKAEVDQLKQGIHHG